MTVEITANCVTPSADWTAYDAERFASPARNDVPQRWQYDATSGLSDEQVGHTTCITPRVRGRADPKAGRRARRPAARCTAHRVRSGPRSRGPQGTSRGLSWVRPDGSLTSGQ